MKALVLPRFLQAIQPIPQNFYHPLDFSQRCLGIVGFIEQASQEQGM